MCVGFRRCNSWLICIQSNYARRVREELSDVYFFVLSDVWLDNPKTFIGLQKMFDNCIENSFIPKVIVMCGNFTSRSIVQGSGQDIQRYHGMLEFTLKCIKD
jgi:DNA polymerase epsilon subunit 2